MISYRHLTKKEYEVMKIVWSYERPIAISNILEKADNTNNWSETSLYPVINSLIRKEYLEIDSFIRVVKTSARLFRPKISATEFSAVQIKDMYEKINEDFSLDNLKTHLNLLTEAEVE